MGFRYCKIIEEQQIGIKQSFVMRYSYANLDAMLK